MKKLVVAATQAEVSKLYAHFGVAPADFVESADVDILITGVGMTATAFALGRQLSNKYSMVLNVGIAGSFDRRWPLGTVVLVNVDLFAELGAEDKEHFISIDELGFGKSSFAPARFMEHPLLDQLPVVKGITVNKVHGNQKQIDQIQERLQPVTESMEGAAVFYCCEQLNIPCLQVRAISNYVEERNKAAWEIGTAIKNLNDWTLGFLTPP